MKRALVLVFETPKNYDRADFRPPAAPAALAAEACRCYGIAAGSLYGIAEDSLCDLAESRVCSLAEGDLAPAA
jgi:hypothetical protein